MMIGDERWSIVIDSDQWWWWLLLLAGTIDDKWIVIGGDLWEMDYGWSW